MHSKKPYTLPRLIVHPQNFSERTHKRGQVTPAFTTVVDNTRMFVDFRKVSAHSSDTSEQSSLAPATTI